MRHNEIRDLTANLLTEVYPKVKTERDLQLLTGDNLSFKLQISRMKQVCTPELRASGDRETAGYLLRREGIQPACTQQLTQLTKRHHHKHDKEKRRMYEEKIRT